jgi:hypothetical protein
MGTPRVVRCGHRAEAVDEISASGYPTIPGDHDIYQLNIRIHIIHFLNILETADRAIGVA